MGNKLLPYPGLTPQQHQLLLEAACRAEQGNPVIGWRDLPVDWEGEFPGIVRAARAKLANHSFQLFHDIGFMKFDSESSKTAMLEESARRWYAHVTQNEMVLANDLFKDGLARLWFASFEGEWDRETLGQAIQNEDSEAEHDSIVAALDLLDEFGFFSGAADAPALALDEAEINDPFALTEEEAQQTIEHQLTHSDETAADPDFASEEMEVDRIFDQFFPTEELTHSDETLAASEETEQILVPIFPTQEPDTSENHVDEGLTHSDETAEQSPRSDFEQYFNEDRSAELTRNRQRAISSDDDVAPHTLRRRKERPPQEPQQDAEDQPERPPIKEVDLPSLTSLVDEDESEMGPRAGSRTVSDMDWLERIQEQGVGSGSVTPRSGHRRQEGPENRIDDATVQSDRQHQHDDELPRRPTQKPSAASDDEPEVRRGQFRQRPLQEGDTIDLRDVRRPTVTHAAPENPLDKVRRTIQESPSTNKTGRRGASDSLRNQGPRSKKTTSQPDDSDEIDGIPITVTVDGVMVKVIVPDDLAEGLDRGELYDQAYRMVRSILDDSQYGDDDETDID